MLTSRQDGDRLFIRYRPRTLGIVGGVIVVVGVILIGLALPRPHTVTLRCERRDCVLERSAVIGGEREVVTGLRGARANQELVLLADREHVMGPYRSKRSVPAYVEAADQIDAYLEGGARTRLELSVMVSTTIWLWGVGFLALVIGLGLVAVFLIGSRTFIERGGRFWRAGSRLRGQTADIVGVEVDRNAIVARLRGGGDRLLVSTLGGLKRRGPPRPRPDLETVARRVREFLRT